MSYASERQPRRHFLGLMGLGLGGAGFLAAGAGGGGGPHDLLSTTHEDTLPGVPVKGDLIVGDPTPVWARLARGATGTLLKVKSDGTLEWSTDTHDLLSARHGDVLASAVAKGDIMVGNATPKWSRLAVVSPYWEFKSQTDGTVAWQISDRLEFEDPGSGVGAQDVSIVATGENQAAIPKSKLLAIRWGFWLVEIAGTANNSITFEGAVHDDVHAVRETFRYNFAATGAGDIFRTTCTIFAVNAGPNDATGDLHLNVTALTLNGGTVTVKQRFMMGIF